MKNVPADNIAGREGGIIKYKLVGQELARFPNLAKSAAVGKTVA